MPLRIVQGRQVGVLVGDPGRVIPIVGLGMFNIRIASERRCRSRDVCGHRQNQFVDREVPRTLLNAADLVGPHQRVHRGDPRHNNSPHCDRLLLQTPGLNWMTSSPGSNSGATRDRRRLLVRHGRRRLRLDHRHLQHHKRHNQHPRHRPDNAWESWIRRSMALPPQHGNRQLGKGRTADGNTRETTSRTDANMNGTHPPTPPSSTTTHPDTRRIRSQEGRDIRRQPTDRPATATPDINNPNDVLCYTRSPGSASKKRNIAQNACAR